MHGRGVGRRWHLLAVVLTVSCGAGVSAVRALASAPTPERPPALGPADPKPLRPSTSDLAAAAGAMALWPLDDRGRVARDAVGGHDGTVRGPVGRRQVGQGPGTYSDSFDGGTARVTAPATGLAPGAVAASLWFRAPRHATRSLGSLLDTGGLRIGVAGGRVTVTTCAAGPACRRLQPRAWVADGAWHQVAVSVGGGRVTAFVDGVVAARGVAVGLGAPPANGRIGIGRHFVGDIDQVALYRAPLDASTVAAEFTAGACPQAADTTAPPTSATATLPALPLHTRGRFVVDADGRRVKLAGVSWYGAEELDRVPAGLQCQSIDAIAAHIAADGFNLVRLPWATDTWLVPRGHVPPVAVAADPSLRGRSPRAVFDAVVDGLARHGLMVVLDNHVTRPGWCCSGEDGNALWWEGYRPDRPPHWSRMSPRRKAAYARRGQARWLRAWRSIAGRYGAHGRDPQPAVVGADLRNEPRTDRRLGIAPRWRRGRTPAWADWPRAATRAGDAVLRANPRLLVVVEGDDYATDLRGARVRPVRLARPHRLVYSAHDYAFTDGGLSGARLRAVLQARWGWLARTGRWYTTPVWVGEFGRCHPGDPRCRPWEASWFATFIRYLRDGDFDWSYWSVNGTGAHGSGDPTTCSAAPWFPGCDEYYGVSDDTWVHDASPALSAALRGLQPPAPHR